MKLSDAAHILQLHGVVNPEDIKAAYRRAAKRYHPDRNPAGLEMMKLVNAAFDELKGREEELDLVGATEEGAGYPDAVFEALIAIAELQGLEVEVCGAWVWVFGETKPHRESLKGAGFRWAPKKKRWYFRPEDWKSASRGGVSMDEIREKYGSTRPELAGRRKIEGRV